jgi:prefoldin subunit 5
MNELPKGEDRLRAMLSRLDQQIEKFQKVIEKINAKKKELNEKISEAGLEHVPVSLKASLDSNENIEQKIEEHLLELKKTRNLVLKKLERVLKEEELFAALEKQFKGKIKIKSLGKGDFEVSYADSDTKNAEKELMKSKQNIEEIKKLIQK